MELLETPDERFAALPGYAFAPHRVTVDPAGLGMHYVDEGPRDGPVALLLHGEPSWSYLYRSMIPPLLAAGMRVVVPDLVGFGKSSKPTRIADYTYQRHVDWMHAFVTKLALERVTMFAQDWGSLIGLRVAAEEPDPFAALVVGNGFLPDGRLPVAGVRGLASAAAFLTWRTFARFSPVLPVSRIVEVGAGRRLTADERRAYDAPFPDARYQAGARAFPLLVPITPSDPAAAANRAAWERLRRWEKPFVTAFSTGDPITRGLDRILADRIPGAAGRAHQRVRGGHFLQERSGPELAAIVAATARDAGVLARA